VVAGEGPMVERAACVVVVNELQQGQSRGAIAMAWATFTKYDVRCGTGEDGLPTAGTGLRCICSLR
jgi:hypothetical protein